MPIMSVSTFKSETHKYFSIRNGAIGTIDAKLRLYHSGPNQARLIELRDAVDAFKNEKNTKFGGSGGDYTDSKRETKGGVTLLGQQVAAELAAVAPAPLGIGMGAGIAQQARLQALARQVRAEADYVDVNVPVTQQLDYRDGAGIHDFAWTVQLRLIEKPTELRVRVAVKPTTGIAIVGNFKNKWATQIQQSWNGAQLHLPAVGGGRARTLPINFEIDWKPDGYSGAAYTVDVHQPPPQPAQGKYAKAGTGWVKQDAQAVVGTNVGTPHMGQWGADDGVAVVHEFGHMIGCPDEYYTKTFNGLAMPADIYDQVPFTTDSIMNNTGVEGRIFPRHYHLIRRQYEIWKGLAADSTTVRVTG